MCCDRKGQWIETETGGMGSDMQKRGHRPDLNLCEPHGAQPRQLDHLRTCNTDGCFMCTLYQCMNVVCEVKEC